MDRKEIKELAKEKIRGNKWNIWWPFIIIAVLESVLSSIFGPKINIDITSTNAVANYQMSAGAYIGTTVIGLAFGIVMAGYLMYILKFVRTGKFDSQDIISTIKSKWLQILIASILAGIIVALCSMLLVIPGIIMALAYSMVMYLVIDTDVTGSDSLKKSREMMKGHKWEYFVFQLSFIGWIILVPFTLGLLMIWLYPYMVTAETIYYDKLKELTNN